jgi:hypothetical protein
MGCYNDVKLSKSQKRKIRKVTNRYLRIKTKSFIRKVFNIKVG